MLSLVYVTGVQGRLWTDWFGCVSMAIREMFFCSVWRYGGFGHYTIRWCFVAVCLLIPLLADSIKGFLREFRGSGSLSAGATEVRQQVAILSCGDPPKWLCPPSQILSLSCDAGCRQDVEVGALGWVLRDHEGQLRGARCRRLCATFDLAGDLGYCRWIDSLTTIRLLRDEEVNLMIGRSLVEEI